MAELLSKYQGDESLPIDASSLQLTVSAPVIHKGFTRRQLLKGFAGVGLALVFADALTACVGTVPTENLPPEFKSLIDEINALPGSSIKDLLQERAAEYFTKTPPFTLNRGGLDVRVHDTSVKFRNVLSAPSVHGTFTSRMSVAAENFLPKEETKLKLPLGWMIPESERNRFPAQNRASDGTPFIDVTFKRGVAFFEGVSPEIIVERPSDTSKFTPLQKDFAKAAEKFSLVKEACSLLAYDIAMEESYKTMQRLGFATHIRVDGSESDKEAVNQMISTAINQGGRWRAVLDLAAYVLALKATEQSDFYSVLRNDSTIWRAATVVKGVEVSGSASDVLRKAVEVTLTKGEIQNLQHQGNLSAYP